MSAVVIDKTMTSMFISWLSCGILGLWHNMATSRGNRLSRLFAIQIHPFCLYMSIEIYSHGWARRFQCRPACYPIKSFHLPERLNRLIHFISAYLSQSIFSLILSEKALAKSRFAPFSGGWTAGAGCFGCLFSIAEKVCIPPRLRYHGNCCNRLVSCQVRSGARLRSNFTCLQGTTEGA